MINPNETNRVLKSMRSFQTNWTSANPWEIRYAHTFDKDKKEKKKKKLEGWGC